MTHKKKYEIPYIEIERFDMDIDIASVDGAYYDMLKQLYNASLQVGETPSEEGFQTFLTENGYADDFTSGLCYYTSGVVS